MSGSVYAEASRRDLFHRLKRRKRMSRLVMALLSATLLCAVIVRASQATAGQSPPARPTAPEQACGELVSLTFEGDTTITASTTVSTGALVTPTDQSLTGLPAFCRVIGVSRPTSDSDIRFEVWLPADSWNGKFLSSGEVGSAPIAATATTGRRHRNLPS